MILIFLSLTSFSQNTDTSKNSSEYSRNKKWAIQFEVGYDFKITSFNALLFSLKYHVSDRSAFRLGIGYNGYTESGKIENDEICTFHSYDTKNTNYNIVLVSNYIYYVKAYSRFNIFWGAGPTARYSYSCDEFPDGGSEDLMRGYEDKSWAAGINGIFGIEWMPFSDFSLFAEYEASGYYGKSYYMFQLFDKNYQYHEKDTEDSEFWRFEGNYARLGLSVYFDRLF